MTMLMIYRANEGCLHRQEYEPGRPLPQDAVWLDLLDPAPDEVAEVERVFDLDIPTREEMHEIELSSRLYEEDGALVMTATVLAGAESGRPGTRPVTFILAGSRGTCLECFARSIRIALKDKGNIRLLM